MYLCPACAVGGNHFVGHYKTRFGHLCYYYNILLFVVELSVIGGSDFFKLLNEL